MKTENWANKAANDYYDTGIGQDVTETPATEGGPAGQTWRVHKKPYWVKDAWQAAYLDVQQIPFLSCELTREGKPRWYFDNDDDRAFLAGKDFWGGEVTVPLQQYRQSYRHMLNQLTAAREATNRERGVSSYDANRAA